MNNSTKYCNAACDFMRPYATPDKDFFQLSSGETEEFEDRIAFICEGHGETVATLNVFAKELRLISARWFVPTAKVKELVSLAEAHAAAAEHTQGLLDEIYDAIVRRCVPDDQELENLVAALECK